MTDRDLASGRHAHISAWIGRADREPLDPSAKTEADFIISQTLQSFDEAVKKLRALRR